MLQKRRETMAIHFKGAHFPPDIILMGVRWYVAYPLSTRHVEELMLERGVHVDHSTINRWVVKYSPQLEEAFHRRKRPVWVSWRMDETYIKVRLLLDSRVVDVPMTYNSTFVMLSSLKSLFFSSLKNEL
jgi:putative transposase